jgi:hypothetical protein
MCLGNRRQKVGKWLQEENDDVWEYIDVRGRDLGMEGTGRGRESAEKYLRGVLGMDRETPGYIMREECRRNRLIVKAWRSGKIESKRKMDECRAEWKGERCKQARKKGENKRIQIKQGVWEVYDRGRESARKKNHGEIYMWERGERKQVLFGRREKKV